MYKYIKDGVVFTQNEINRMKIDNPISLGFKVVQDIIPEHDSYRVKVIRTEEIVDGKYVYVEEPLTIEERTIRIKASSKQMLFTIDKYLDTAIVKIKEYDNRDAIGKYLLPGNPFFDEVSKISLWIANTYILCNSLVADIIENDKDVPSIEEVISSIPDPDFLTEEEFEAVYKHATLEPHNCLYINTHPTTSKDKRLRRNFDVLLSIVFGHQTID